jgi:hypothetical protein
VSAGDFGCSLETIIYPHSEPQVGSRNLQQSYNYQEVLKLPELKEEFAGVFAMVTWA